jgi:multidrug efflux pump subunit AcrA (membrane-fusion protein)
MSLPDKKRPTGEEPAAPFLVLSGSHRALRRADDALPALRLVRSPWAVLGVARGLGAGFPLMLLLMLLLPWQQSSLGSGEVIAFAPADRAQTVEAPIKGRIQDWHVMEGEVVEKGQLLATLADNDPAYFQRLEAEKVQVQVSLDAAREGVKTYRLKVEAERTARELAIAEYEAKVLSERRKLTGEQAELETARLQRDRVQQLAAAGIESTRKLELAEMKLAKVDAAVEARLQVIAGAERARDKAAQSGASKVASAEADLQAALSKEADARRKLVDIDVKLARQSRQDLRAPRAGTVLRLHGGPEGTQIKPGDTLVTLVPETKDRAVAIDIDGNDVPLISKGDEVRVLFEGWPAIQFSGWPELSTGTFPARVAFIDATDNGKGKFRIVVVPDPEGPEWPSGDRLRQGVRARGFVLLSRVTVGYELWRQINGFPPLPPDDLDKGKGSVPPNQKKPRAPKALK